MGIPSGSNPRHGDQLPLLVTVVFPGGELLNGQVLLDGSDSLWVTGRPQGDEPGNWQTIARRQDDAQEGSQQPPQERRPGRQAVRQP